MRIFNLQTMSLAALMMAAGAMNMLADDETTGTTIHRSLPLSEYNQNYYNVDSLSIDYATNTLTYHTGGGNSCIGWLGSTTSLSGYTKLVLELSASSNLNSKSVFIGIGENGYWDGKRQLSKELSSSDFSSGTRSVSIDLTTAQTGDGTELNLDSINMIFICTTQFADQTIVINDFYLEKTLEEGMEDYVEIDVTKGTISGTDLTYSDSTLTATGTTGTYGFSISDDIKESDTIKYQYLVIAPRKAYSIEKVFNESDTANTTQLTDFFKNVNNAYTWYTTCTSNYAQFSYGVNDGTYSVDTWGLAYGEYQRRRAMVIDLWANGYYDSNTSTTLNNAGGSIDLSKLDSLWIRCIETHYTNTYKPSAIYFTNCEPSYNHIPWESPTADYIRDVDEEGTYGTICLPYNWAVTGADIYEVVGYGTDNSGNPSDVYLEEKLGVLEAGKAYLYITNSNKKGVDAASATDTVTTNNSTTINTYYRQNESEDNTSFGGQVLCTRAGDAAVFTPTTANGLTGAFCGSNSTIAVPDTCYILVESGDEYVWGKGSGNTVGKYRAYLNLSDFPEATSDSEASAKGWIRLSVVSDGSDDGTTGIKEIVSEEQKESVIDDDAIYNLSGVRVTNPQKGIYIKNGKKYIIK